MSSARSDCFSFSALVYDRLPKNLRNMVYDYLCLDDRRIPIGPYYHFRKYELPISCGEDDESVVTDIDIELGSEQNAQSILPDGRTRTDHDVYPPSDFVMPKSHIFKRSFMGKGIVLEMLEEYYKNNTFSICNVNGGLDSLCTNVSPDSAEPAIDFTPIDYIHDLQIRIKCEHFDIQTCSPHVKASHQLAQFAHEELFLRRTVESLAAFRSRIQLSTPHELNIEIVLMSHLGYDTEYPGSLQARVINLLQMVRNFVYELKYDCEHTTVKVTHQDDGLRAFPKDYTGLFQLTKDQWNYEKSRHQSGHDWTHDFWVVPSLGDGIAPKHMFEHGGYFLACIESFLRERWGVADIVREGVSKSPVVDGKYWPIGAPYHSAVAKALIERLIQEETDNPEDAPQHPIS